MVPPGLVPQLYAQETPAPANASVKEAVLYERPFLPPEDEVPPGLGVAAAAELDDPKATEEAELDAMITLAPGVVEVANDVGAKLEVTGADEEAPGVVEVANDAGAMLELRATDDEGAPPNV